MKCVIYYWWMPPIQKSNFSLQRIDLASLQIFYCASGLFLHWSTIIYCSGIYYYWYWNCIQLATIILTKIISLPTSFYWPVSAIAGLLTTFYQFELAQHCQDYHLWDSADKFIIWRWKLNNILLPQLSSTSTQRFGTVENYFLWK